jgi:very-short-patch-repair endonuclease/predicted transcriptional regulator of viral defense system
MGTECDLPPLDLRLAGAAERQYGLITRGQLEALGVGPHGIAERMRTGRLRRVHRGVYAVGHSVLRPEAYWLAATLTCGREAALSHASAAALWEIRPSQAMRIDVTVPTQAGVRQRRGIRVHRSSTLSAEDVTTQNRIPVTTVGRTLIDLADTLPTQPLKRAIHEAEYRGLLDATAISKAVERTAGRRGKRVLELAGGPRELTRSELEGRFLELCRTHSLPSPTVGARIHGYEVDFVWPDQKLIVETDGLTAHRTRQAMERDRERDRRLLLAGYRTVRLTARSLTGVVARELGELLQAGTSSARSADSRSRSASKPPRRASTSSASAT